MNSNKMSKKEITGEDVIEMSGVETLHPGGFDLSRRIGEVINIKPEMKVLDVSSGKGLFACFYAKEFGCKVTGVDINDKFINIATKRAKNERVSDKVDFQHGDSRKLAFKDNEFDVVVNECAVGLIAINNPQQVLNEMVRVAKHGGKIVIHESLWLKDLDEDKKKEAANLIGTTPYTMDEWKVMIKKAGATPEIAEDWSGIENMIKLRPGFEWNEDTLDFLTFKEKLFLIPKIIFKYGISALLRLNKFQQLGVQYIKEGYLGYGLIVAKKEASLLKQ